MSNNFDWEHKKDRKKNFAIFFKLFIFKGTLYYRAFTFAERRDTFRAAVFF